MLREARFTQRTFRPRFFMADKGYSGRPLYGHVRKQYGAEPIIQVNPGHRKLMAQIGMWENTETWIRISPFFKVGNVVTPTLVLCGQIDWNVPLQNSEQLYQALRRRGIDTELVIYPGQSHGIRRFFNLRFEKLIEALIGCVVFRR